MWCSVWTVLVLLGCWCSALPTSNVCETSACRSAATNIRKRMKPLVDPCADFYEFSCGKFMDETEIPSDKPIMIPSILEIMDKVHLELLELITEPISPNDTKPVAMAKKYYSDCMDTAKREELGAAPLVALIERIGGWPLLDGVRSEDTIRNWTEMTSTLSAAGVKADHLIGVRVVEDMKNPKNRSIYLTPPGFTDSFELRHLLFMEPLLKIMHGIALQLEARDYYQLTRDLIDLNNFVVNLNSIKGPVEEFLPLQMYNPHTLSELQEIYAYVNWVDYLNDILPSSVRVNASERVVVIWPEYLKQLEQLLASTKRRTIANYLGWKVIEQTPLLLNNAFADMYQNLSAALVGNSRALPAWEVCLQTTKENIPVVLDAMYVRKFRNLQSRDAISEMLLRVRQEMSTNLWSEVQWMDSVTKHRAQKKIDAIRQVVSYPDELLSDDELEAIYKGFDLDGLSFFDATFKLTNFTAKRSLAKLRKATDNPIDWSVMAMSSEVNAFFDPMKNVIVIPAATMQGHLFSVEHPKYLNYASIGTIIGHEINHGFDMAGRLFDERGNLTDWWEPETGTLFKGRAKCFEEQYENFVEPINRLQLNAGFTQSEDISDNGGVHLLYKTYMRWVSENQPEAKLPGLDYTPEQLFWIYYGQTWCGKARPEYLKLARLVDPHSPFRFRVIGPLSNSESFARDFHCPTGSAMNPATKCNIW